MLTDKQLKEVKELAKPLIDYIRKETNWIPNIDIDNTGIIIKAIDKKIEEALSEAEYKISLDELKEKADCIIALNEMLSQLSAIANCCCVRESCVDCKYRYLCDNLPCSADDIKLSVDYLLDKCKADIDSRNNIIGLKKYLK